MKVSIKRFSEGSFRVDSFELKVSGNPTILELLIKIKEEHDPTLSFRAMCRASICGTCGVKVNGENRLACTTRVNGEDILIEPMDNHEPIKDLVVDHEPIPNTLRKYKIWISPAEKVEVSKEDITRIIKARDCILCGICNGVCPPIGEGKPFAGPLAFTRLYSVMEDPRDALGNERLKIATSMNPQDCVHCSNCTLLCPKGCMPERWVELTESKLVKEGLIEKKQDDFGFLGF